MADRRSHLIFISYRGSDQNWATELVYARMTEAFGVDAVFKAGNSIRAGEDFPPILRRAAASCPVMLACIGPGWLTATTPDGGRRLDSPDDWVREEIAISLQAGNHVVPLLIGNHNEVSVPALDRVPEPIAAMIHRQAWRLAPGGGLDATIPMLVDRLAELVPELAERRRARSTAQSASTARAPRDEGQTPRMSAAEQLLLAKEAGATLVAAMTGDAWDSARSGIGLLFTRHDPDTWAAVEAQLDSNAALMKRSVDPERTRLLLSEIWRLEFSGLVSRSPAAAGDLAAWVTSARDDLPKASRVWTQTNTARDHGVINAVLHGDQHIHYMDSPPMGNERRAEDAEDAEDEDGS
jgi:hypothetical protein